MRLYSGDTAGCGHTFFCSRNLECSYASHNAEHIMFQDRFCLHFSCIVADQASQVYALASRLEDLLVGGFESGNDIAQASCRRRRASLEGKRVKGLGGLSVGHDDRCSRELALCEEALAVVVGLDVCVGDLRWLSLRQVRVFGVRSIGGPDFCTAGKSHFTRWIVRTSRVVLQGSWPEWCRQDYFDCFAAFDCAVPNAPEMRLRRMIAPPSA
jgi:hypothetical protein